MSTKIKDKHINNVYNFEKEWTEKCSIYNSHYKTSIQPNILPATKRIIVIGDIHGDWDITIKSLKLAKVIDDNNNWIGKDTIIVQVGDQIDRCRYSGINCKLEKATQPDEGNDWKILKYFTHLHEQAQKENGAVYSLIGNHELMNVIGDFRYVSYLGHKEFDNYKSVDGKTFDSGEAARKYAFAPGNEISNFLACTRQMALIIGSNLFVHAGILPKIANKYKIKDLNMLLTNYLWGNLKSSEYNDIFLSSTESPLWNRDFGNLGNNNDNFTNKDTCNYLLEPLKEIYQVDRIYVGHTPILTKGITSVCNDKIWLTDYGASKAFDKFKNGNDKPIRTAQVLEILDDGKIINILK